MKVALIDIFHDISWQDSRSRIMQIHSRKMNYKKDDVNFIELARSTDDFNGAQLKARRCGFGALKHLKA